jgi:hypothetical protein
MNRITKEDGPPTGPRPHSDDPKLNNCDSSPMKLDKKARTNESNKRNQKKTRRTTKLHKRKSIMTQR